LLCAAMARGMGGVSRSKPLSCVGSTEGMCCSARDAWAFASPLAKRPVCPQKSRRADAGTLDMGPVSRSLYVMRCMGEVERLDALLASFAPAETGLRLRLGQVLEALCSEARAF
jgi:hypothetical protein